MTTVPVDPRPQPVIEAANAAGNVMSIVTGLAGLLAILSTVTHWPWALGGAASLATVAAGLSKVLPSITATGAAAQVTPLADPRNALMEPLLDPATYGRHAALLAPDENAHSASMGPDLP